MIIADKVFKGNTEIIRIYKGLNLEWERIAPIPSSDEYILEGLVFQLDGIDKGNVDGAWVDKKAGRQFTLNNCIVNSDNIEFNGVDSEATDINNYYLPTLNESYTIEVVMYYQGGSILNSRYRSGYGSPIIALYKASSNYMTVGREIYALERIPKNMLMCLLLQSLGNDNVQGNYNGNVLAIRTGTNSIISTGLYNNGNVSIGYLTDSSSKKVGHLKGNIYAIRIYNRILTQQELHDNMVIDYKRFKLNIMDEFNIDLSNNLGEKINEALFVINNTLFNYNGSNPIYVPKSPHYFILFNNISNHTAPKAIINSLSKNISAVYTYTGFNGMILEATTTATNLRVYLPFYSALSGQYVDWGDGISNSDNYHTYSTSGTYTIRISGTFNSVKLLPLRDCNYITKIILFPYNITIIDDSSYDYMKMPHLTYVAPLITNRNLGINTPIAANFIDSYSAYTLGKISSVYLRYADSYATLNKDVDTLILGTSIYGLKDRVYNINNLYKCNSYITFDVSNGIPPYMKDISAFKSIRWMEIPREFWEFYGNSIKWDFSNLSYWGTENKQCVINSLINNTVDLVSMGETSLTIMLNYNTYSLLTSEEIALITSKGYTITY